jgi:hypothetical protein
MYGLENSNKFTEKQKKRLRLWYSMPAKSRDYDRMVGSIPYGAYWGYETKEYVEMQEELDNKMDEEEYESCCSCHINSPCSFCTEGEE